MGIFSSNRDDSLGGDAHRQKKGSAIPTLNVTEARYTPTAIELPNASVGTICTVLQALQIPMPKEVIAYAARALHPDVAIEKNRLRHLLGESPVSPLALHRWHDISLERRKDDRYVESQLSLEILPGEDGNFLTGRGDINPFSSGLPGFEIQWRWNGTHTPRQTEALSGIDVSLTWEDSSPPERSDSRTGRWAILRCILKELSGQNLPKQLAEFVPAREGNDPYCEDEPLHIIFNGVFFSLVPTPKGENVGPPILLHEESLSSVIGEPAFADLSQEKVLPELNLLDLHSPPPLAWSPFFIRDPQVFKIQQFFGENGVRLPEVFFNFILGISGSTAPVCDTDISELFNLRHTSRFQVADSAIWTREDLSLGRHVRVEVKKARYGDLEVKFEYHLETNSTIMAVEWRRVRKKISRDAWSKVCRSLLDS